MYRNASQVLCRRLTTPTSATVAAPVRSFSLLRPTSSAPATALRLRQFSRFNRKGRGGSKPTSVSTSPPPTEVKEEWTAVTDKATGEIYYWNEKTNEVTHLGAPNPNHSALAPPPQQEAGGMMSGLGGMVAQGMAFGTGSAIAHTAIGSIFGGGGGSDGGDQGGDDDGFDI